MAVLNRHQELPRDRAELYDPGSGCRRRNRMRENFFLVSAISFMLIGRREKQEMLRRIAFEMHLKRVYPQFITRDKLRASLRILTLLNCPM